MSDLLLPEDRAKAEELKRMKTLATSLFVIAAIIFIISSIYAEQAVWIGFVQATAEAAMVGAIADWFAVTALFRHPLGLKIPHTAIIPTRKDIIGVQFGRFVQSNFLSERVIAEKVQSMGVTRQAAEWLSQPENSHQLARYVAVGIGAIVEVMRDEDVQGLIERSLEDRARQTHLAPIAGNVLSIITEGERQRELVHGTVNLAARLVKENKKVILEKISEETPWWLPENVDAAIYRKIVEAADSTAREVARNPEHAIYGKFNELVGQFIEDLKTSEEILEKEQAWKEDVLQHPAVKEFSASLWRDVKRYLLSYDDSAHSNVREPIEQGIVRIGETILADESLQAKIDHWVQNTARFLIREYGVEVEQLIAQTIKNWDGDATSRKIELYVGKDLQFIRINGTLVGGFVGFLIHLVWYLFIA